MQHNPDAARTDALNFLGQCVTDYLQTLPPAARAATQERAEHSLQTLAQLSDTASPRAEPAPAPVPVSPLVNQEATP